MLSLTGTCMAISYGVQNSLDKAGKRLLGSGNYAVTHSISQGKNRGLSGGKHGLGRKIRSPNYPATHSISQGENRGLSGLAEATQEANQLRAAV